MSSAAVVIGALRIDKGEKIDTRSLKNPGRNRACEKATVNFRYLEHGYLKLSAYIEEYSLDTSPIFLYVSAPFISNYWYLKVYLVPEIIPEDTRSLG